MVHLLASEQVERVIEPMGEFVSGAEVTQAGMGLDANGGGVYMVQKVMAVDLWSVGVHYWLEIVFCMAGLLVIVCAVGLWRRRGKLNEVRRGEVYCGECGYGLSGLGQGVGVCPECGCHDVGEGGSKRKVMGRRWVRGRGLRWGVMCVAMAMMVLMGLLRYGADGRWAWVDVVARQLGARSERVRMGWTSRAGDELIRELGVKDWFCWDWRGANGLLREVNGGWGYELVRGHWNSWDELMRLDFQDGGIHAEQMLTVDGEAYVLNVYERDVDAIRKGYEPLMLKLGDERWYYNWKYRNTKRGLFLLNDADVMKRYEAKGQFGLDLDRNSRVQLKNVRLVKSGSQALPKTKWLMYSLSDDVRLVHHVDWFEDLGLLKHDVFCFDKKRWDISGDAMEQREVVLERERWEDWGWQETKAVLLRKGEIDGAEWLSEWLGVEDVEGVEVDQIAYERMTYDSGQMVALALPVIKRDWWLGKDGQLLRRKRGELVIGMDVMGEIEKRWDKLLDAQMDEKERLWVLGERKTRWGVEYVVWVYEMEAFWDEVEE